MLKDTDIEKAKNDASIRLTDQAHHEHNDCIRIAYEWLDAQKKMKSPASRSFPLKHLIEN